MPHANNKGADQPAHLRSLISAFVLCCLDSVIPLVSIPEISSLYLASESSLVENPEDRCSYDEAIFEFLLLDWQLKEKLSVHAL